MSWPRISRSRMFALLLTSGVLGACGGDGGVDTCVPGSSQACACVSGGTGAQVCQADGTFGACMCASSDAGPRMDGSVPGVDSGMPASDAGTGGSDGGGCPAGGCSIGDIVSVGAGAEETCIARSDGRVVCWGQRFGVTPTLVDGVTTAVDVDVNTSHACVVLSSGGVACWGSNTYSQLGNGGEVDSATPVSVSIVDGVRVGCGARHSCALQMSGAVSCWGDQANGQVDGSVHRPPIGFPQRTPRNIGITSAVDLAVGDVTSCAVSSGGSLICWGFEIGAPANVAGVSGAANVAMYHEVAVRGSDNTVTAGSIALLAPVAGIDDAIDVAAGDLHACALRATGTVVCWGRNTFGQLGDGTLDDHTSPTPVSGVTDAVLVEAGLYHTCAVLSSGGVACWGKNDDGQLGDGSTISSPTPVAVSLP